MARPGARREARVGIGMAAPATLLLALFLALPFAMGFVFSFTNQRLSSPKPAEYVGLRNFRQMLSLGTLTLEPERAADGTALRGADGELKYPRLRAYTRGNPDHPHLDRMREWFHFDLGGDRRLYVLARDVLFMKALAVTVTFVAVVAPLQAALALLLALLINQPLRFINVFRTIYFMPTVISMVVVAMLWRFIYDGHNGLLNALLGMLSFGWFEPVDWLGRTDTVLGAIIAMSIWQSVGFHMIIWLAGLQTISPTLYEAARVEGASSWQTFRFVTWPGLRNTAVLVAVIITMQAFRLYPQIAVMTNGGPLDASQSLVFQMVERGYGKQDIAGGSALSVFLFLFVLSISLLQRWLAREKD